MRLVRRIALGSSGLERERRRAHLRAELVAVERQAVSRRGAADAEQALAVMRDALTDSQGMLHAETGAARRALRALLAGRLIFTPEDRDGERVYTFSGQGTITPVIAGVTGGVQRVWWPQRDLVARRVSCDAVRRTSHASLTRFDPCFSRDHALPRSPADYE
ncbi:MAG TPA: hypothetical protein VMO26_17755 [Vicinamibacterales bacterium]|nr:hypothetical protein [Vicinamibacterales bacterium]